MSTTWIKSDFEFGHPYRVFTISARQLAQSVEVRDFLRDHGSDPAKVEQYLQRLVGFYRPALKDCAIVALEFRYYGGWRICVMHPTLLRTQNGQQFPEEELIEGEERRVGMLAVEYHKPLLENEPMVDPGAATLNIDGPRRAYTEVDLDKIRENIRKMGFDPAKSGGDKTQVVVMNEGDVIQADYEVRK